MLGKVDSDEERRRIAKAFGRDIHLCYLFPETSDQEAFVKRVVFEGAYCVQAKTRLNDDTEYSFRFSGTKMLGNAWCGGIQP